jgi:transglutaminase-like putative cysteine protease
VVALLKSCSAYEAYLRTYRVRPRAGAASWSSCCWNRLFPRSVFSALVQAEQCLAELQPTAGRVGVQDEARRLLGRSRTDLEFHRPAELVESLGTVLVGLQATCAGVGEALAAKHFQSGHASSWAVEPDELAAQGAPRDGLPLRHGGGVVVQRGAAHPPHRHPQLTLESRVETTPAVPQHRYWDYWGTQVTAFEVPEPHDHLAVVVRSVVETSAAEPLPEDAPGWEQLRDPRTVDRRFEWLVATSKTEADEEMAAAATEAAGDLAPAQAVLAVADAAADRVTYEPGSTGVQTSAPEAWRLRRGVCQDIAHVSLGMLRSLGVPARYVSGYLHPCPRRARRAGRRREPRLVEVWLGEWWGYDPTNRQPAGERHVVVARGREYRRRPAAEGGLPGATVRTPSASRSTLTGCADRP